MESASRSEVRFGRIGRCNSRDLPLFANADSTSGVEGNSRARGSSGCRRVRRQRIRPPRRGAQQRDRRARRRPRPRAPGERSIESECSPSP